jgi:hypothetical protein
MATNKVEIGFDLSGLPDAEFARLDDPFYGLLDAPQTILGGAAYQDVTPFLLSYSISRGKSRQLDRYQSGRLQVTLDNNTRLFDPLYQLSPYRGQIIPKRAVRVTSNEKFIPATLDTNLVTNPSFEAQSVVTTTNLVTNPSFETDTTGWIRSGGTSFTRITTDSVFGSACGQFIATGAGNLMYIDISVTAAQTYVFSAYVKGEAGKTVSVDIEEVGVGTTLGTAFTLNGTWQRMSVTRTFTTGTTARCRVQNRGAVANTILIDGAMLTVGATTETYFDGNTTGVNDTTFAWTGTVNNSSSTRQSNALVPARTNLMPNPNFELNATQWSAARMTVALDSTTKFVGEQALRGTVNATTNEQYFDHGTRIPVTVGRTYTASVYVFLPVANTGSTTIRAALFPHTGSAFLAGITGTPVVATKGQWTRISVTGTMPATTTSVMLRVAFPNIAALNDVMIIDGVLIEEGTTVGDYFDGNTSASGDFIYDWAGIVGLSQSRQEVRQIVGSSASTNAAAGMSRAWDSTGVRSLLVAPNIGDNDSHIRFSYSGLTVGETYTALVKCRLSAPLTGTLNARSRQISAWNSTFTTNAGSATAPNTAGEHELRFTFTANDTTMIIALHNGASVNNGLVWFDDLLVVAGDYAFEYFDGNTYSSNPIITYAWAGTPNDSQSTRSKEAESLGIQYEGLIDDWDLSYAPQGNSIASIVASDAFSQFANQTLVGGTAIAQTTGERIETVLQNQGVQWPTNAIAIEQGVQELQAGVIPNGASAFGYLQTIAQSEPGSLFIDKTGVVVFKDRQAQTLGTPVEFSDDGTGIPYQELAVVYGSELLYNEVEVSRQNGGTALAVSLPSQTQYGIQNYTLNDLPLDTDQSAENLATYLVSQYGEPEYRFEAIEIELRNLTPEQQDAVLAIELTDFVRVKFTPNNVPPAIDRYAEVIGISHRATPASHKVSFNLASTEYNFFRLSDLVFGRLSTGNALGY